jgi:hypothetical protein
MRPSIGVVPHQLSLDGKKQDRSIIRETADFRVNRSRPLTAPANNTENSRLLTRRNERRLIAVVERLPTPGWIIVGIEPCVRVLQ